MAIKILDPVQGLVDYVLEVKPYHTKIVEVLVEYVYTDCIDVTITEELDFCFNLGMSGINSNFAYNIVSANIVTNEITIAGPVGPLSHPTIVVGQTIQIVQSTDNNGPYIVKSMSYNLLENETTIELQETITSDLARIEARSMTTAPASLYSLSRIPIV